ncbi:precorrin-3B synthase [Nonomuraea sp. NPDC049709]|uniref:precorrin-3B synthase n=1 Tax=Nonomuraea sp. NPDC049709 TaxID=3154736 RepID=UPI00341BD5B0
MPSPTQEPTAEPTRPISGVTILIVSIADFSGRVRPDACPGALQVHEAADGPLARVRLPGGAVSPAQLRELASCAADLGSGVIELTSRANVQVRGLRSPTAFASRIAAAGLLPSPAHERVRNIVASPLGGRGPGGRLDTQPLVRALDEALCAHPRLAELPGRFLFALDDGTGDVTGLGADVTFAPAPGEGAASPGTGPRAPAAPRDEPPPMAPRNGRLLLAGSDTGLTDGPDSAVPLMIAAAEAFLDERSRADGAGAWRLHELPDGPARITARITARLTGPATGDATAIHPAAIDAAPASASGGAGGDRDGLGRARAGRVVQRDGRVAVEAVVPLGRLSPGQARALADSGGVIRLTPWRTAVLLDLSPAEADRITSALDTAGLVTDPRSPWAGVTACTGHPGCAKSRADVQADARRWVAGLDEAPETPVHWSGCERRCGLPRGRVVQLIATTDGYEEHRQ